MVYVLAYWKNCTKLAFLTSDSNYKETKITFNFYDNMHKMISSKILEGMNKFIYTSNSEHRELYSNMGMRMQHTIFFMMRLKSFRPGS